MIERRVACFPADRSIVARVRGALGLSVALEPFVDIAKLLTAIRAGAVSETVVVIDVSSFEYALTALRRIHTDFPSHPLIAYSYERGLTDRHVFLIAQTGITDFVNADDSKLALGRTLESAQRIKHAEILFERLECFVPANAHSVFRYALEHAGESLDVPQLAAALGVNKRTLTWRLKQQRMPSPRLLLTWCRILVASMLLDEPGRTLQSVAGQLDFSDGHNLGMVVVRYLGRGIEALRKQGVMDEAIRKFRSTIEDEGEPASIF